LDGSGDKDLLSNKKNKDFPLHEEVATSDFFEPESELDLTPIKLKSDVRDIGANGDQTEQDQYCRTRVCKGMEKELIGEEKYGLCFSFLPRGRTSPDEYYEDRIMYFRHGSIWGLDRCSLNNAESHRFSYDEVWIDTVYLPDYRKTIWTQSYTYWHKKRWVIEILYGHIDRFPNVDWLDFLGLNFPSIEFYDFVLIKGEQILVLDYVLDRIWFEENVLKK